MNWIKKIIAVAEAACLIAAAGAVVAGCEGVGGDGADGGAAQIGIRFPAGTEFSRGEDVIVLGSGFSADAAYFLESGGSRVEVKDVTVTESGIFFTVNVQAGTWLLVREENGVRREIGTIYVSVPLINITVGSVPEYCLPGERFSVVAMDFDRTAALVLEAADGTRTSLETEAGDGVLTAVAPADGPRGKLRLLIVQENGEMAVRQAFFVTARKRLTAVEYTVGIGMSSLEYKTGVHVRRGSEGEILGCEEYLVSAVSDAAGFSAGDLRGVEALRAGSLAPEAAGAMDLRAKAFEAKALGAGALADDGGIAVADAGDIAVAGDDGIAVAAGISDGTYLIEPQESANGYLYSDMSYWLSVADGRVSEYSYTTDGGERRAFAWTYDAAGYLAYAVGHGSGGSTFWFDLAEENIVDEDWASRFIYGDATLVRNPFAVDFALATIAATNDVMRLALVYGLTGTASRLLPSELDGQAVTYTYDGDGYPVSARYTEPQSSFVTEVAFRYE